MGRLRAMHAKRAIGEAASNLQDLIDSGEDLLETLKDQRGAAAERLRERVSLAISNARDQLADSGVSDAAAEAYDNAVGFVRADPWRAVAIGTAALLVGSVLFHVLSDD